MARKKAAAKKNPKKPVETQAERINKSPRERFRSIVPARLDAALKRMRMLKRCAGTGYDFTEGEAAQIVAAIRAEAEAIEAAFFQQEAAEVGGLVLEDDSELEESEPEPGDEEEDDEADDDDFEDEDDDEEEDDDDDDD